MKKITTTTLLTTAIVATACSQALIYESFSQTAGDLNGQAGGTGLNSWSDDGTVTVGSSTLSHGDLQNAGGEVTVASSGGTDAWVTLADTGGGSNVLLDNGLLADGATIWFSYVYQAAANGGSNEKAGFAFGTDRLNPDFSGTMDMANSGNGVGIVSSNTSLTAATWNGTDPTTGGSINFNTGETIFAVGRIDWGATVSDDETITLYSPSLTDLGTLGSSVTHTLTAVDQTLFDTISFAQRNSGGDQIYDEIRFGASYDDVAPVPEPSAFGLLAGCFAMTWVMLRRRNTNLKKVVSR